MKTRKKDITKKNTGYLFIAPYFIVFFLFTLYPIIYTLILSFQQWDGVTDPVFLGLDNYVRLVQDSNFFKSIGNTILISLCAMVPQMVFGLSLAFILNQRYLRRIGNILKPVYYFPNLVTAVSIGILFSLIFDWQAGSANKLLMALGLISEPFNWKMSVPFSRGVISFILWWQYFGYYTIIFTAGIKGIPAELNEAAEIDGANRFQQFTRITLPQLRPIMTYAFTTSIIGGLQIFDLPYAFGSVEGNPDKSILTMVMYMYGTSFKNYNYGYGAAIAYGLFVIVVIFSSIFMKVTSGKEEQ